MAMERQRKVLLEALESIPFMKGGAVDTKSLAKVAKPVFSNDSTALCQKGEMGDRMYVLVVGKCEVIAGDEGEEKVVAEILAPGYFGEMSLIGERKPRMATVSTVGQCDLFEISASDFDRIVNSNEAALKIARDDAKARFAKVTQITHDALDPLLTSPTEVIN